jgi:signal transduction histidine kinase
MPATDWLRARSVELFWFAFAGLNVGGMLVWPNWETIPFHFIWVSLTILFGFRLWRPLPTYVLLVAVAIATGTLILLDARRGEQPWGELFEVPLMTAMFLAMVWHARRRQEALQAVECEAERRASLLEQQERFLHDASHELRTPVTIARGHLEVLRRLNEGAPAEVEVVLDELGRIEQILDRLLLLAAVDQPDFIRLADIDLEPFLEDVFMRWSEVAPRAWRLGPLAPGSLRADPEGLREALDALFENAVKHTQEPAPIELRSRAEGSVAAIEVADGGSGIPADAIEHIFERFARADPARGRTDGGVGLGLAIVDAIAKAHHGRCSVRSGAGGSTFTLRLPGFTEELRPDAVVTTAVASLAGRRTVDEDGDAVADGLRVDEP